MSTLIVRAQGELARRDQFIDMVTSRMQYSEAYFSGIRARLPRLYDLWRGIYTGRFHPHKNNVHIPIIFSHIWADAARKAATSLNTYPIVNFLGYGPDDSPMVRKREALISAQMKDAGAFLKEVDTFVTADLYGVAISQVMWDHTEERRIITDSVELPLSGEIVRQIRKMDVITFDGPNWENVDRLDFFPAPGFKSIKKMPWVIRRYFLDLDDLRFLVSKGMFDRAELDRLIREGGAGSQIAADEAAYTRRFQVRTGMSDQEARWMDKFSRPIEMLEMWGRVPSELSPDGVLERVITVANRRYLMRNRPNPFWHGRKPFISFSPMPDPHYFDAPGKAEIAEKLQITANRFVNQKLDGQELVIDPMMFYNRQAGLVTRGLYSKPGRFIGVDGDPSSAVYPFTPNMQGLMQGERAAEEMRRYAAMGTGMYEDSVMGAEGPDRETARAFVGRRENAGTRLLLESRIYEEGYLEPLANLMVSLNKQFLQLPKEVLILGDSAIVDPVTGEPLATSREILAGHDLTPDYAARAIGASSALSRGVRQQNISTLFQSAVASEHIMGATNVVNFWRMVLREFEVPNINEIVAKQLPGAVGQAGGAAGIGGIPTSGQIVNQGALPSGFNIPGGGVSILPGQNGMPADLAGALA